MTKINFTSEKTLMEYIASNLTYHAQTPDGYE